MKPTRARAATRIAICTAACGRAALLLAVLAGPGIVSQAHAQEIRYSWVDMSYMAQDMSREGSLTPLPGQTVDIATNDGTGVHFRGSLAVWKNIYAMIDYASTDIGLSGSVSNTDTGFVQEFADEFDYTAIRGGVGVKYTIFDATDVFGELTYDSLGFDFGSFAGENFDMDRQEVGGALGIRRMFGRNLQLEARGRYTNLGDADLTTGVFDSDVLFGVGFAWQVIRGLSVVGDVETGEFANWSLGFRIDLDED
jgi:hypothetical protein